MMDRMTNLQAYKVGEETASTFGLVPRSPVFIGIRTDTQNYRKTDRITNRQAYKVGDYCFNVGKE